jgi:replication factor A1
LYKSIDAPEPSFEVVLIKEKFGKEPFFHKPESCQLLSIGSGSNASATYENLPPLVPIGSKKMQHQVQVSNIHISNNSVLSASNYHIHLL